MTFQRLVLSVVSILLCRAEVDTVTHKKVVEVGGNITLSCLLTGLHDILQVTWQKKNNNENLATYSLRGGVNVADKYQSRLNFTRLSLNDSAITIWQVRLQDDGCYTCIFNTFPSGAIPQDTCFTVYEELRGALHYTISKGNLTATCSASARPRPVISWIVPNVEGEETTKEVQHANGTVSVNSTLYVNSSTSLLGQELTCRVQHMEKIRDYTVKVNRGHGQAFSVSVSVALAVLFLLCVVVVVLAVVYYRRYRKKQSAAELTQFS